MEAQSGKIMLTNYVKTISGYEDMDEDAIDEELDKPYGRFIGYAFVQAVSQTKSGKLVEDLANQYALNDDKYPIDLPPAPHAVIKYRNYINNPNHPSKNKKKLSENINNNNKS